MARRNKGAAWSMKRDRELIGLSKSSLTLEAIAERLRREPDKILKSATRLGLTLNRRALSGLKARGK
jgi:hypothetical protein